MTEQTKREFFQLVVEKETTKCWSWIGEHDVDGRPVFRGDKAYRIMYQLRVGDVPDRFHVHHKCENSACVNPRHLVALSPEAHRAVHATKDKILKERIYRGEWERIQAEKAQAERLAMERLERARLERERLAEERRREQERLAEEQRKRAAAMAAEEARKREERRKKRAVTLRKLCIYGTPVLACELVALYYVDQFHRLSKNPIRDLAKWVSENPVSASVPLALLGLTLVFFIVALGRREQLRKNCAGVLRELYLYGTPVLAYGLLLYCVFEFDWFSQIPLAGLVNWISKIPILNLINWLFKNFVVVLALILLVPYFFFAIVAFMRREKVRNKCAEMLRIFHLYGTPALVCGLLLYVGWQFDWFLPGTPSNVRNELNPRFEKAHPQTSVQIQKGIDDDNARLEQYRAELKKYQPATPDMPITLAPTPAATPEKAPRATLVATPTPKPHPQKIDRP